MPRAALTRPPSGDPEVFWLAQYQQACREAKEAKKAAPSAIPKYLQLQREAWRELQAAKQSKAMATAAPSPSAAPSSPAPMDTSLEAQLAEVQRMRREAQIGGKLTAAEKLLRREGELAEAIQARDELAAKRARTARSASEVVKALVTRMQAMPEILQDAIRAGMGW